MLWKFGFPSAFVVDGWLFVQPDWIHLETRERRSTHPAADSPVDLELYRDAGEPQEWNVVRLRAHPDDPDNRREAQAADLCTGKVLWRRDFELKKGHFQISGGTILAGDVVVIGQQVLTKDPNFTFHCPVLDLETGEELWCFKQGKADLAYCANFWPACVPRAPEEDAEAKTRLLIYREDIGALEARDRRSGRVLWTTKNSLPVKERAGRHFPNGAHPFARAGRVLWIKYLYTVPAKGKTRAGKPAKPKDKAELVSIDYVTGQVLHRQGFQRNSLLVGQHAGSMLARHGSTLTCFR